MTTLYQGLGQEQLIDELLFVVHENLNDMIDQMQTEVWTPRDDARALRLGIDPAPHYDVENIVPINIHIGDIPALVNENLPENSYPNICITPEPMVPDAEDAAQDHLNVYQNVIDVHCLAKASPTEGAQFTYFRAVRTAEALHETIVKHPKLSKMLEGASNPMVVQTSPPFAFQPQEGHGDDWWWRAARIRYQIKSITARF